MSEPSDEDGKKAKARAAYEARLAEAQRLFPAARRDRQARGKDCGDGLDDLDGARLRPGASPHSEAFAQQERRRWAATVLGDPELLMMWAQSNGDSIPSVRLHFTRILCGFDDQTPQPGLPPVARKPSRQHGKHHRSGSGSASAGRHGEF